MDLCFLFFIGVERPKSKLIVHRGVYTSIIHPRGRSHTTGVGFPTSIKFDPRLISPRTTLSLSLSLEIVGNETNCQYIANQLAPRRESTGEVDSPLFELLTARLTPRAIFVVRIYISDCRVYLQIPYESLHRPR